jgi:regulator of cell morphogenesis and NO signaling
MILQEIIEMMAQSELTIGDMVVANFRTAAIFQKYGIDFCCRGNRTLAAACTEKGINQKLVALELEKIANDATDILPKFDQWELNFLIDYIVSNHHGYVRKMLPVLYQHTTKIASVHGSRHPELVRLASGFASIGQELEMHMRKEEQILFPYIKSLVAARHAGLTPPVPLFGSVRNPIAMMEREHQSAGDEMAMIHNLTSNYTPPEDACTTYRVTFQELQDFEQDLHQHVHLENNILFPKAILFENALNESVPASCGIDSCSIA